LVEWDDAAGGQNPADLSFVGKRELADDAGRVAVCIQLCAKVSGILGNLTEIDRDDGPIRQGHGTSCGGREGKTVCPIENDILGHLRQGRPGIGKTATGRLGAIVDRDFPRAVGRWVARGLGEIRVERSLPADIIINDQRQLLAEDAVGGIVIRCVDSADGGCGSGELQRKVGRRRRRRRHQLSDR